MIYNDIYIHMYVNVLQYYTTVNVIYYKLHVSKLCTHITIDSCCCSIRPKNNKQHFMNIAKKTKAHETNTIQQQQQQHYNHHHHNTTTTTSSKQHPPKKRKSRNPPRMPWLSQRFPQVAMVLDQLGVPTWSTMAGPLEVHLVQAREISGRL